MPQRRLLTVTLAGLLAMVGFPGIGPSTAVQAQSEQDCEDVDCVADEQSWEDAEGEDSGSWEDEASAEPESDDQFADESEAEPQEESLAGESEPEAEADGADFAQAEEEEEEDESASDDEPSEIDNSVADMPVSNPASETRPALSAQPAPAPVVAPTPAPPAAIRGKISHATDADFDLLVLESDVPVLVYFWASWCQNCQGLGPVIDELADEYGGRARIVMVDVDAHPNLGGRFEVLSVAQVLVFKGGQVVGRQVGLAPKSQFKLLINRVL